jgi:LPXTG-site transpeptidase (sortase) family protein
MLKRRRFLLLAGVALLGTATACASSEEAGLRGSGTVLRTPEAEATATPVAAPTSLPVMPSPTLRPTLVPVPTEEPQPIVPPDALPADVSGGTDAEMHVAPVITGKPPIAAALPARRIVIPTIGLDSKVIQLGTKLDRRGQIAWETAPFAVGQHRGLAGPGQIGNMVLSGHISSPNEGAVFHRLPELKVGEGIIISTDERQYLYQVTSTKVVTPDEVSVMDQTPDATATLLTCVPDGIYSHRLVVSARLVA